MKTEKSHFWKQSKVYTFSANGKLYKTPNFTDTNIGNMYVTNIILFLTPSFLPYHLNIGLLERKNCKIIFYKSFSKFSQWKLPFSARSTFLNELSTDGDENIELD